MRILLPTIIVTFIAAPVLAGDSWVQFASLYGQSGRPAPVVVSEVKGMGTEFNAVPVPTDEWRELRDWPRVSQESRAPRPAHRPAASRNQWRSLHAQLAPYRSLIREAAVQFDIPVEVISAVVMVESSGDRYAQAQGSSAKGLMQTIDATFAEARQGLREEGIAIRNDPFDPRASILAGSWYLDRMFRQVEQDLGRRLARGNPENWRQAAEYYYAGPDHGRLRSGTVTVYAGGRAVTVDKAGYGRKVMKWARGMG